MAVWIYWSCEPHFGEPCFRWMDSSYHDINHREMNVTNMWYKAVQDSKWKFSIPHQIRFIFLVTYY